MKDSLSELRLTETNSAEDSAGRTWGLEGNLFWYVVAGVFIAVAMLLISFSAFRWSFTASTMVAAVPLTVSLIYVFGFRRGKPAGHDRDLLDGWLNGSGFGPDLQQQPEHPLHHDGTP